MTIDDLQMDPPGLWPAINSHKTRAMLTHLSALIWLLGIPFGSIAGPMIVMFITKREDPVKVHAIEAFVFHVKATVAFVACLALLFLSLLAAGFGPLLEAVGADPSAATTGPAWLGATWIVGVVLFAGFILVYDLVTTLRAAFNVHHGRPFTYPFSKTELPMEPAIADYVRHELWRLPRP